MRSMSELLGKGIYANNCGGIGRGSGEDLAAATAGSLSIFHWRI